jgi:hypothetical protein
MSERYGQGIKPDILFLDSESESQKQDSCVSP